MSILQYLKSFGDAALERSNGALYSFAAAVDDGVQRAKDGIENLTDQLYLKSASGVMLERWAQDLLQLKRKPLETDDALRSRIVRSLFLANGTRAALRSTAEILLGRLPTELFEPVRDSAYFDSGFYCLATAPLDSAAAADGSGSYCARYGSADWTPYCARVKLQLPGLKMAGGGLAYYDGREYADAAAWASDAAPERLITLDDICAALAEVKPAGVRIELETF